MRLLITGATGFIGRNLAEHLHAAGHSVVATGRSREVGQALTKRGIDFRPADISDPGDVASMFVPADCVIHCAARSGDWGTDQEFHRVNVLGTRHVLAGCHTYRVPRLIFMSTPSLYFNGNPRLDITESEPVADPPQTAYARTKLTNEKELTEASRDGLLTISLRPRAVHGPWDRTITPRILRMASKKKLPLINNGEALTDITYIENLNRAVECCLRAPSDAWNEVYNISNGEPISIHDWFQGIVGSFGREFRPKNVPLRTAHAIARVMELASRLPVGPSRPLMTRFSVGYMGTSMTMSIDKARKRLGYSPAVSNQEGFRRMAHWFQAHDRSDG